MQMTMTLTTIRGHYPSFRRSLFAVFCVAGVALGVMPGSASPQCGARDKLIEVLGQKYRENRQALGLAGDAAVFELYVSDQGTWTLLSTGTSGLSCIVAAGEAWQSAPKVLAGRDS
jgi:hypothetical protein